MPKFKSWNKAIGLVPMPILDTYKTPRVDVLRSVRKVYVEIILGEAHIFDTADCGERGERIGYALIAYDGKMVIAEVWTVETDRNHSEFEKALATKYGRIYAMEID